MARLILKSPYIKSTGGASGYLRYIATRERVELMLGIGLACTGISLLRKEK